MNLVRKCRSAEKVDRQRKWVCVVRSAKARPTHRARSWCVVVAHEAYCSCAALLRRATPRQMCTAQQKPNDADGMMRLLPTTGRHISFPSISHCNFRPAQPPSNPPVMHAPALCTHSTQYYYQYNARSTWTPGGLYTHAPPAVSSSLYARSTIGVSRSCSDARQESLYDTHIQLMTMLY